MYRPGTVNINRNILGIKINYYGDGNFSTDGRYCPWTYGSPFYYRVANGQLYQQANGYTTWDIVQKVKIGTGIYKSIIDSTTNTESYHEIYQVIPKSPLMLQFIAQGNNSGFLA
jgi:hypothetical protein